MSYERLRHECERCGAKFLTDLALRGHRSTHADDRSVEVIKGP